MFHVGGGGRTAITPPGPAPPTPTTPHPCTPLSGSPGQLQDASSLDSNASGQISLSWGGRSPGKASPFRGRTMKEYEEQLATLKKDNFALKLRIYFLEERMGQKCDRDDKDDLYRTNIELKVETEALKQELYDKQELVRQASTALASLEHQYQEQLEHARREHSQEAQQLNQQIQALQKEVESYSEQLQQGTQGRLGELTQLCGLAFSTEEGETALGSTTSNPLDLSAYPNPLSAHSPVQGVFSLPAIGPDTTTLQKHQPSIAAEENAAGCNVEQQQQEREEDEGNEVEQLRERVVELEGRVEELEEELAQRQDTSAILQEDLDNLRKEVEEKVEKIGQLEEEVTEKDQKVEAAMQELEMQHSELATKDHLIQKLHQDLHRVEPEIEVKVQEIVERDRIIEEKIEQIEQQNKILVEIQITLDEKQKQLADMEQKVEESEQKVTKLTQDLDKSCKVIQSFAEEVHKRDKEIANLKKELKRKEKKVRDLVAELKETLDMLKKAKWEAETSGGEDGVKEMAEEENERLWAELESRKNEALALQAEHKLSLAQAHDRLTHLQEQLDEKLKDLENQKELHAKEIEGHEAGLREKAEQVARLEGQLQALQGDMSSREGQLKTNQDAVDDLQRELGNVKAELQGKKTELESLQEDLKKKNADMQDLVNRELWERNREVERLQDKLASLTTTTRGQLEAKDEELMRLRTQLTEEGSRGRPAGESVAQITVVAGSCGPDMVTVNRPLNLSMTEDNGAAVQLLQREVNLVREEARALRLERSDLNNKLSSLQQLYDQTCHVPAQKISKDSDDKLSSDSRETMSQVQEQQSKSISDFQGQVEVLCGELQATKKRIGQQMTQVNVCKYREALRRHKQEIVSLRKRLADSHNACDMLRTRLEELADFLERILELEEQGLINLSQLCPSQLASMHKSLDESRALSRSLSMSLMIGMDLTDQADPTLLSTSSWSLQEDNLSETHECPGQECYGEDVLLQEEDSSIQAGVMQMELKTKEFEVMAQNMSCLSDRLGESTQQVREQAKVISELRAEVTRLRDQAHPQHHSVSSADLSEPLPPPPLHLLQDSEGPVAPETGEGCVASDHSSRWGAKSGSSTDTAIKAHSYHLGYLQQQQQQQTIQERRHTEGSSRLGLGQEQVWAPVSPSESEAWSEPDRNVSLARIGLDTSSLGGALDRSTSRSRQHRPAAALTSESEAEIAPEDPIPAPLPSPASASKASKRRSDVAELRRVTTKLRAVEQLNDTLRAELNIYQTLNQQLLPETPAPRPTTSDKSVETHKGETADAAVGAEEASPAPASAPGVLTIPTPLLEEIRGLRGKLEEAITNNDQLRDQLEAALTAHPQDEARFLHLTAAIQTAQEEQREAREKLQASQTAMKEQEEKSQQLNYKLQQCEAQLAQQQQQLETAHQQASAAEAEASQTLQAKELNLKEQAAHLNAREQEVKQLQIQVSQLQEQVAEVGKLQEKLQRQETRLLEVNKERMSLVGERARLQAQLASASTQARLQESHTSVLQQLEAERSTVATLQKEREYLMAEKERLEKGTEVLKEEVATLQAKITHLRARHSHSHQAHPQHQQNDEYYKNNNHVTEKQGTTKDMEQCVEQQTALVRQLTAQLEAERQLTTNLQLQLKTLRNTAAASPTTTTTTASSTHCHDSVVEPISSPESVTSIEYYHQPLPDPSLLWRRPSPNPVTGHSQRERRSSSSGRRRERESSGRRVSSTRWSENKENIYMSSNLTTTTTTTTTSSSTTKRSRLSHSKESQGSILVPPLHHSEEEDIDGGTTSGESPDLGIGSDHHFSSLERGTSAFHHHNHDTAAPTTRLTPVSPLPPPTPLCSEPSHSALTVENQQLREESENLKVHLASTKETLKEALEKLSRANQRKENVERAICKQLHKTHDVLKKAKSHLKQVNTLPQ